MDIYELKRNYHAQHPSGHFFDPETLKFFGERLSEMRVLKSTATVTDCMGETHKCYVVSKHSTYGRNYAYFDTETFEYIPQ